MVVLDRAQLERSVVARLCECSHDEIRVIDRVLQGVEQGREDYGPLDLRSDHRLFDREAEQELRDTLFYLAAQYVADQARARDARQAEHDRLVESGLTELRRVALFRVEQPDADEEFDLGGEE